MAQYADCVAAITSVFSGPDADSKALKLCQQFASSAEAALRQHDLQDVSSRVGDVTIAVNTLYLVISGALVFIMHGGFAMLCAGAVRSKNTMNILLQTVMDAAVSAVAFYLVGFGFAYGVGDKPNGFIGDALFGLARWSSKRSGPDHGAGWQEWFFQWAFAATAATIPAGAVAERLNFNAYLTYSAFISAFVYPVIVHWAWSPEGWLGYVRSDGYTRLFRAGYIDFAGSGVVHMVGGLAGLAGCLQLGPRMGRFDSDGKPLDMPGHSATLQVLGTVLLWFGWYGFNPGSQLVITTADGAAVVGRAAVTTTLAGAAGCLGCLATAFFRHKAWDLVSGCNGALVGFVAVTAGAHVLEPWAALLAGLTASWVFDLACWVFLRRGIDDPLSAAPMHGVCGAWGVFFTGLLAKREYICQSYGRPTNREGYVADGLFYSGDGRLLASQVIGIICIFSWTFGLMSMLFYALRRAGKLRINAEMEAAGLDISKHGGVAYASYVNDSNQQQFNHGLGKPDKASVFLTRI